MSKPVGIATRSRTTFRMNEDMVLQGVLTLDNNSEVVRTNLPKPDPKWQAADSNGHFHARANDETYPTLKTRTEHVECDGSCGGTCDGEGYTVTHYDCVICGEDVTPGLIPGPHSFVIPGMQTWAVKVISAAPVGQQSERVTVRFEDSGVLRFGVAEVVGISYDMGRLETELVGISPLGQQ